MTILFAQPYDISAYGFYFDSIEQYDAKASVLKNDYGDPVEEFEIQFIDGDDIDCALAFALGINQADLSRFFDMVEQWDDEQKTRYVIAVGEGGYAYDCDPDDLDIDIYELNSIKELAEQFVDEGLFGEIPERIACYLDYDLIACDLAADYSVGEFAGRRFVYRCG